MEIIKYKTETGVVIIYPAIIKDVPKGTDYEIIDDTELPDRHFRDAWKYDLSIDIKKAKEIQKKYIIRDFTQIDLINKSEEVKTAFLNIDDCKTIDEIKSIEV